VVLLDANSHAATAGPTSPLRPVGADPDALADIVIRLPLFSHLNWEQARFVSLHASRRTWPRGSHMVTQGDPASDLFVLMSGSAEKLVASPDRREIVTDIVVPGEAFGEAPIIDGGHQTASIRSSQRCEVLCVRPTVLAQLLPHDNVLTLKLLRHLCVQVRRSRGLIRALGLPTVRERTLDRIAWLQQRQQGSLAEGCMPTHTALARFVGANRETVSRAVASLVEDGIVRWRADAMDDPRGTAGP